MGRIKSNILNHQSKLADIALTEQQKTISMIENINALSIDNTVKTYIDDVFKRNHLKERFYVLFNK